MPPWSPSLEEGSKESLVSLYFSAGHKYEIIRQFLHNIHGIDISLRQLKRVLKRLGLRRRLPGSAGNLRHISRLIRVSHISTTLVEN